VANPDWLPFKIAFCTPNYRTQRAGIAAHQQLITLRIYRSDLGSILRMSLFENPAFAKIPRFFSSPSVFPPLAESHSNLHFCVLSMQE
jgi:hypothetical protein